MTDPNDLLIKSPGGKRLPRSWGSLRARLSPGAVTVLRRAQELALARSHGVVAVAHVVAALVDVKGTDASLFLEPMEGVPEPNAWLECVGRSDAQDGEPTVDVLRWLQHALAIPVDAGRDLRTRTSYLLCTLNEVVARTKLTPPCAQALTRIAKHATLANWQDLWARSKEEDVLVHLAEALGPDDVLALVAERLVVGGRRPESSLLPGQLAVPLRGTLPGLPGTLSAVLRAFDMQRWELALQHGYDRPSDVLDPRIAAFSRAMGSQEQDSPGVAFRTKIECDDPPDALVARLCAEMVAVDARVETALASFSLRDQGRSAGKRTVPEEQVDMPDFLQAFRDGARFGRHTVSVHTIGRLQVTSGRMIACDPLVFPETEAFTYSFPCGHHSVVLSVARVSANDERVALAMLAVDGALPVRWERALVAVLDESSPGPGQPLGYCVDAGLGCFMDEAARKLLFERMRSLADHENYYDAVVAKELRPNERPTWGWCLHKPNPGRSENVAIFSSGWGDGVYSTTVGFDARGNVACLVTDFDVLDWG